jgi:hypothetical protein
MSETTAERIIALQKNIADLDGQRKKLLGAIGPVQQGYSDGKRLPPRQLTQMENAAIKRANDIEHRLTPILEERDTLVAYFLSQLSGKKADADDRPDHDPELLLRAALRIIANLYRDIDEELKSPDLRVMMRLLLSYIRSLEDPDLDEDDG